MKVYLMELIKELKNDNNNAAKSMASVNVTTIKIEEILEETPTAIGVEVEPMKLSQESVSKKLQFLRRTLADFPKGL